MIDVPTSNYECAQRIYNINIEQKDLIEYLYGDWAPVQLDAIGCDLADREIEPWTDLLSDIQYYENTHYDEEDPDCSALLHEIELLLDYLSQI